jgi:hypothetical protein
VRSVHHTASSFMRCCGSVAAVKAVNIWCWHVQPLIPMATVLEGALLGAVDTSYIAKRTGLGIAIALAVIYGALVR